MLARSLSLHLEEYTWSLGAKFGMSEVTSKLIAGKIVEGIKKAGQSLGPGYVQLAAKYSTEFFARKIGEETPGIRDIDQALEYSSKNMKAFVNGYTAFAYGAMKAESTIQGATGAFARMVAKTATTEVFEKTGFRKALGKASDSSEALSKYYTTLVKLGSMKQEDLNFTGSDGVLELQVDNCPYADACIAAVEEGISRILGGHGCVRILSFATIIEVMTGKQQDYKLRNLSPPRCSGTILES
jgi:hypothetical protein